MSDVSSLSNGVNPVLLIAVPLGLAFAVPLFGLLSKRIVKYIPIVAFIFNLMVSLILIPQVLSESIIVRIGGYIPPFCINLVAGPVAIIFSSLISLAGLLVSIYALTYIKEGPQEKYHMLYLLLLTGATGVVLTGDIFNLFVFFEILCISSYALVAYIGDKKGIEASVKYLIQGAVGSSLLLIGVGLLYGMYGTLNMADLASKISSTNSVSVFVPLALMITGLGVEAAIFPMNAWLPDAHSSAPSSISAILSGIAIEVGLYAVIRILFTIFDASNFLVFFLFMGVLTLLIGEFCAFAQKNIKRMLAYSSIGQIGLIVFAFSTATSYGVTGGLFQLITHTLCKALLFLSVGYMIYRSGSMDISSLEGMGKKMPYTSLAFTIGAFSLVGLPPFIGFPSKFMIVRAALFKQEILFTILIGIVLLATIIEVAYFLRVVQTIYFKGKKTKHKRKRAPVNVLIALFIFAGLIVVIGIYPKIITNLLDSGASELLNKLDYINNVIR
jgi:proton-translocating NADH-quinone oxidoreductase chain N